MEGQAGLEYQIYQLLKEHGLSLTTAESATGGMIAATLVNVPGISAYFTEGYVTYSDAAKVKMIGVAPETIADYGVVSEQTASEMAVCARRTAGTDLSVSVTGVAGPDGGSETCPVGLVFLGCCFRGKTTVERHQFSGDRKAVRSAACEAALLLVKRTIEEEMVCGL